MLYEKIVARTSDFFLYAQFYASTLMILCCFSVCSFSAIF